MHLKSMTFHKKSFRFVFVAVRGMLGRNIETQVSWGGGGECETKRSLAFVSHSCSLSSTAGSREGRDLNTKGCQDFSLGSCRPYFIRGHG